MARNFGAAARFRVARLLYWRWEALAPEARAPLERLAADVKERALEVRGRLDDGQAAAELERATGELAEAMGEDEVAELRLQLKRELERVERGQRAA